MQDVPVAIQAFDSTQIERYAATTLTEIADLATQVTLFPGSSGNGASLSVRGLGSTSLDPGIDASVGINIDGMQTDRGHIVRQAFFDLQNVQVLKGPQALFFGKNSPAGVLAVQSALPGDEFEARGTFGYEFDAEEFIGEIMVSTPLTETLAVRFAYRGSDHDGFLDNDAAFGENSAGELVPGLGPCAPLCEPFDFPGAAHSEVGGEESHAARLTLEWQPTDNLNIVWRTLGTTFETDNFATLEVISCSGALPVTNAHIGAPVVDSTGDCSSNHKLSHGSLPPEIAAGFSRSIGNGEPFGEYDSWLSTVNLEWELENVTLTSVTGYYWYDYTRWDNFDGTNFIQLMGIQIEDQTTWSQEFRALTTYDSPFNFMFGAFYEHFERDSDNAGKIFPNGPDPRNGFYNNWEGASTVESDSYSLFGQVVWTISDALEFTAGARYTDEDKDAEQGNVFVHLISGAILPFQPEGLVLKSDFDDTDWSPEVTLTWRPADNMTVYAAYRTGYKSGGFSTNTVLTLATSATDLVFQPEEADGYEIGLKTTLLDGRWRLNVNAYTYDFDDLQVSAFDSATTTFTINNAAAAETTGIEFETEFLATDDLTLRAQLGYNDGEFDDFKTSPCYSHQTVAQGCVGGTQDLGGEKMNRAPEWQGSVGFTFERPINSDFDFLLAGEAIYMDEYDTSSQNNPLAVQDDYWRVNMRVGISSSDGRWELSLIGRNIFDEEYISASADKPGGVPAGTDIYSQTIRARQVILQGSINF
jgi:outer membrane receptor protein involved in Fe transport